MYIYFFLYYIALAWPTRVSNQNMVMCSCNTPFPQGLHPWGGGGWGLLVEIANQPHTPTSPKSPHPPPLPPPQRPQEPPTFSTQTKPSLEKRLFPILC